MKALVQRVQFARVEIAGEIVGQTKRGFLLLLGITEDDTQATCDFLAKKAVALRVFPDDDGKMNRSLADIAGEMLVVSQFTLCANCTKGRRPSFIKAARPELAIPLYERFVQKVREQGIQTATGRFGADMQVFLQNDGPVTILLDTADWFPKEPCTEERGEKA